MEPDALAAEIRRRCAGRETPLLVAIDGGSGAGKSRLAAWLETELRAARVPSDDFFAAHVTAAEWDRHDAAKRASLAIDWRRLRSEVLEPLLAGRPGRWHRFDFEAGERPDGTYGMHSDWCTLDPAPVIVLDGAYSTRPELSDLIDLSVLVDTPIEVRHARLREREEPGFLAAWHARWDAAEAHYFEHVRPAQAFDWTLRRG